MSQPHGYMGKLLRIDLSRGSLAEKSIAPELFTRFVGGVGLGAYHLWQEVAPEVEPLSAEAKLFLFTGPLTGSKAPGSGTSCCVLKSPYTGLAGSTQSNGYFGAFLKSQGFDGLIIEGKAPAPCCLIIDQNGPRLEPAEHLWGLTTGECETRVKEEAGLPGRKSSVFCIGPAGENQVKFASFLGDGGHAFGHNGVGALLGSKRLKAICVTKGDQKAEAADPKGLAAAAKELRTTAVSYMGGLLKRHGTAGLVLPALQQGILPVKNLTTNLFEAAGKIDGRYLRSEFKAKPKTCFNCPVAHNAIIEVTSGPYQGLVVKEPEYELLANLGSNLGIGEPGAVLYLADLANQLGMNGTETGWALSWIIECSVKGLLTPQELDGLKLGWGDAKGAEALMKRIALRQGLGDLLAEGVRAAAQKLGGMAAEAAVYAGKGASPRGHDHRGRWNELLDTCTSDTGTIEASFGPRHPEQLAPPVENLFDHLAVARVQAEQNGWRTFDDCVGLCRFCANGSPPALARAFGAATGQPGDMKYGLKLGRRVVNLLRMINLAYGMDPANECPSDRYGSIPVDGPNQGVDIMARWDEMRAEFYQGMGWDPKTGRPLPETLREMGLEELIA